MFLLELKLLSCECPGEYSSGFLNGENGVKMAKFLFAYLVNKG
nr:MAG TPA: hypothetical protein [Caudoviricetes sp.]